MDRYEAWMKDWTTYKFNWINSEERVDAFVLNAIPPGKRYSTMLHFQLSLEISRVTGHGSRINQKNKCIEVPDGYQLVPSIHFQDTDACSRYPWSVRYSMLNGSEVSDDEVDVLDRFGLVSFRLTDFRRVSVLKIVRAMKLLGFGVLHGEVGSDEYRSSEPSGRSHSKIPVVDDPIWMYV